MSAPTLARRTAAHCAGPECGVALAYGTHHGSATVPQGYRRHAGRGLCPTCWSDAVRNGTIGDYQRITMSREILLDEWDLLRPAGVGRVEAAARLGVSLAAFERALYRAAERRDPRAVLGHR